MRRRQLYALEAMEAEQRAEIERQKELQRVINQRNIEYAKQQAGIMWPDAHGRLKAPYQITVNPSDTGTQPAQVARSGDVSTVPSQNVDAPAAPINEPKRRGRPPKVR